MSDKRVAVVTGGARGIGAAITEALARDGVHVAAGYSRNREAAEDLAGKLTADGLSVSVHQGNVGRPEDCQRVVDEVLASEGRIDYLVNNAGVTVDKTVRKMTVDDWHTVLRVNLSGAFYMTKALLDHGGPLRAGLLARTYSKAADNLVPELLTSPRRRLRRNAPARASASAMPSGADSGYSDPLAGDLAVLSARERDVIELVCFPGHTYVDVAMLCGLDEAVVKRSVRSGLGRMGDARRTSRGGGRRRRGVRRQSPRRPA